jgi:hypothetical protein
MSVPKHASAETLTTWRIIPPAEVLNYVYYLIFSTLKKIYSIVYCDVMYYEKTWN